MIKSKEEPIVVLMEGAELTISLIDIHKDVRSDSTVTKDNCYWMSLKIEQKTRQYLRTIDGLMKIPEK